MDIDAILVRDLNRKVPRNLRLFLEPDEQAVIVIPGFPSTLVATNKRVLLSPRGRETQPTAYPYDALTGIGGRFEVTGRKYIALTGPGLTAHPSVMELGRTPNATLVQVWRLGQARAAVVELNELIRTMNQADAGRSGQRAGATIPEPAGASSSSPVEYPVLRLELAKAARALADADFQAREWAKSGRPTPTYHLDFEHAIAEILDTGLLDEPTPGAIGKVLVDTGELAALQALASCLNVVLDEIEKPPARSTYDEAARTAGWIAVRWSARTLLEALIAGGGIMVSDAAGTDSVGSLPTD